MKTKEEIKNKINQLMDMSNKSLLNPHEVANYPRGALYDYGMQMLQWVIKDE